MAQVKAPVKAKAKAKGAAKKAAKKRPERSKTCTGANCQPPWKGMKAWAEKKGFTVTATTNGEHNPGSAHYSGRAIDIRTRDKTPAQVDQLIKDGRAEGFTVIDERQAPPGKKWSAPHVHMQVPPGKCYPPCS